MTTCNTCRGSGNVLNPEWDRQYDKLEDNYPTDSEIRARLGKMGIAEHIPCKVCNGKGEIE